MILKNGTVFLEDKLQKLDIRIENGTIVELSTNIVGEEDVIDCSETIISPAFVDLHAHLRIGQEYKEDPEITIKKAIRGGYCAINVMPNTLPPVNSAPMVEYVRRIKRPEGFLVMATGAITNNGLLTEIENMAEAGAVAISDDGNWTENSFIFYQALKYAKRHNLLVIDHAQDTVLFKSARIYEGQVSFQTGLKGFPKAAEAHAIYRDGTLNLAVGARLHITHLSTVMGLDTISFLRHLGSHVTTDVTPHHLLFDDSAYLDYDTKVKANPPFGDDRDRKALIHALRSGEITAIATDHAPHSEPEKDQEWEDAPYGIASIDSAFEALYEGLVKTDLIPLEVLLSALSTKPAQILGLEHGIKVGNRAHFALIKENEPHVIASSMGAKNNPYVGKESSAKIAAVILNGTVVHSNDQ